MQKQETIVYLVIRRQNKCDENRANGELVIIKLSRIYEFNGKIELIRLDPNFKFEKKIQKIYLIMYQK